MNVSKWSNVQVAVQSALAPAVAITAVTQANPGVVSATGHTFVNGDFVTIHALGMWQIDTRIFRVANVVAGASFALEDEDTTDYDDFISGDAELITFGNTMTTATGLTASGGDFDFIDVTTIHDNMKKQIPGVANPVAYKFENIWDPADAALKALKKISDNQAQCAIRFTFANSNKVLFNGYVGATLVPVGNALDKVTTSVDITAFGRPTIYTN